MIQEIVCVGFDYCRIIWNFKHFGHESFHNQMNKMKAILKVLIIGNAYVIFFNFTAFLNWNLKKAT
jgi:hypothetical protein